MTSQHDCPVLLLDGGLGTSLQDDYGVTFDNTTPLWSSHLLVSDQPTLLACQADFGRVPVDIILTATYQASAAGFAKTRTPAHPDGIDRAGMVALVRDAVRIAHEAGGKVALSVGPYGACMVPGQEYSGKYDAALDSEDALRRWHAERLAAFGEAGGFASPVAYLALETIPRVDEIRALRRALDDSGALAGGLPYWTAALFPGEGHALPDGADVQTVVDAMLDPSVASSQPWGLGINCTKLWKLDALVRLYEDAVDRATRAGWLAASGPPALVLYPDGTNGEVYNTKTQTWDLPEGGRAPTASWDEQMAEIVRGAQSRGRWRAVVAGGCCKTSHGMLSALRTRLGK